MTSPRPPSDSHTGFTTLELLLVTAIVAFIAATVMPFAGRFRQTQTIETYRQSVIQALRLAQSHAVHGERGSAWGVQFQGNAYTVYAGTSYASRTASLDRTVRLDPAYAFSGIDEVTFGKVTGAPSIGGIITITEATTGLRKDIIVNGGGLAESPSPSPLPTSPAGGNSNVIQPTADLSVVLE